MHNGCWVNYYEKHSLRWHICLTINQTTWLLWIMSSSWFDSILNLGKFTWTWQKRQSYIAILVAFFLHCTVFFTCLRGGIVTLIAFFTFLHSAFSNVSSNHLPEKRHSHIGCICLTFLHCAISNVSSNRLPLRMQSHIGCICFTFLHCAFPMCICLFGVMTLSVIFFGIFIFAPFKTKS